jgi:hypothetical protein
MAHSDALQQRSTSVALGAKRTLTRCACCQTERETAIATGCDEFDAKPIEFESLVATIRRVVANPK